MEFKVNLQSAVLGLMAAQNKVMRACEVYGNAAAVKMEGYAKEHAPWTDRTGNARQTITGTCGWGAPGNISVNLEGTGQTAGTTNREIMRAHTSQNYGGGPGSKLVLVLSGNMDYSPYLEFCRDGKYAILYPTVNALQGEIISSFAAVLRRTV